MARSSGADLRAPLWDIVENGVETSANKDEELTVAENKLLKENIVRDAKALGIIQGVVSDHIFPRIAIQETANAAWNVRAVKLQGLHRDFEYTLMGENESFSTYLVRLFDLIGQMRSYGENNSNQRIVQKLLISLPRSYDSIASIIENTKDLDTVDVQDVVAILKRRHNCHKLRHIAKDCRGKKANQHANFVNQVNDTPTMFYVCNNAIVKKCEDTWYVDSGCSNHMTGKEKLLVDIDRTMTTKVEMGTGPLIEVIGKGNLAVKTKMGKRYIKEVMLVPGLQENLLSVG
ncbi:unnamed protein product [Malus baccata var. baccata]